MTSVNQTFWDPNDPNVTFLWNTCTKKQSEKCTTKYITFSSGVIGLTLITERDFGKVEVPEGQLKEQTISFS